jgi:16S rRNA (guanine527-N7)-methyltransferase
LLDVLHESQRLGLLGRVPLERQIKLCEPLLELVRQVPAGSTVVDLGTGGGVPGLVLASACPDVRLVLVERRLSRADQLRRWAGRLGLARVEVAPWDAAAIGRGELRGAATLVTARSFAPPAVVAELAAPLLAMGGRLAVLEPRDDHARRWSEEGLELLGLGAPEAWKGYALLRQHRACPDRFPRRDPRRHPLWGFT